MYVDISAQALGGWRLQLRDDGQGLQPADRHKPDSYGLRGLTERVRALGGHLSLEPLPGSGRMLVVDI